MAQGNSSFIENSLIESISHMRAYLRQFVSERETVNRLIDVSLERVQSPETAGTQGTSLKVRLFRALDDAMAVALETGRDGSLASHADVSLDRRVRAARVHAGLNLLELAQVFDQPPTVVNEMLARHYSGRDPRVQGAAARAFVIEDDTLLVLEIKSILEELGFTVCGVASTRREAVEMGQTLRPDLLIVDFMLAGHLSGLEAAHDLKRFFPNVPMVFVTSYAERLMRDRIPDRALIVPKPFVQERLSAAVAQAFDLAGARLPLT